MSAKWLRMGFEPMPEPTRDIDFLAYIWLYVRVCFWLVRA